MSKGRKAMYCLAMDFRAGDTLYGFTVKHVGRIDDYRAESVLLEHRTGFQVYAVLNDDSERFFSYAIYTPPSSGKGISHIIEHTVLAGSRKYPVKDPFMLLVRNSPNTFLNALTGVDRTYFPAASTVVKDFDNIFSVYTDAVFDPLLRKETFMQEGIRMSSEGGLHFEGVVFSEMLGVMSEHESVVSSEAIKPLFGSSPYRYESGGDCREIASLEYDEYIEAYRHFYVPSNMMLFLYGNISLEEKLRMLDEEYLKNRDSGARVERCGLTPRWTAPKKHYARSGAENGDSGSTVMVSWLLGDNAVPGNSTLLSLIVDILLGSPGCPLYKAISESDLGTDLSTESGMSSSYRELTFSAGFSGSDEADADRIESFIMDTLRAIVRDGFDRKAIEAAIRRMEFSIREIPAGMPMGMRLFFQAEKALTFGTDPEKMLSASGIIAGIRREWEENPRFFEDWIEENLIENNHRLLAVISKDPSYSESIRSTLAEELERRKGAYSQKDEEAFIRFQQTPDPADALSLIPRLSVDDLPHRISRIKHSQKEGIYLMPMMTGGIVYTDILFDVSDFTYEELDALNIFARLLSMCGADGMDYPEFQTELRFVSGGYAFYLESGSDSEGTEKVFLTARLKSLPGLEKDGLDLLRKLFLSCGITEERIKAALTDISTDFQSSSISSGHTYAMSAAAESFSPSLYIGERISGMTCWYIVKDMLASDISALSVRIAAAGRKAIARNRMLMHITAEDSDMDAAWRSASEFALSIPEGESPSQIRHEVPSLPARMAYTASTDVSFVGISGKGAAMSSDKAASDKIYLSILSSTSLWKLVREQGGAYGVGAYLDYIERIWSFYSYRDPRLDGTVSDFISSALTADITEDSLSDAVIGELSKGVKPMAPAVKSLVDIRRIVYRINDDEREKMLESILALTIDDIEAAAERFSKSVADNHIAVITSKDAVSASALGFSSKSLPS